MADAEPEQITARRTRTTRARSRARTRAGARAARAPSRWRCSSCASTPTPRCACRPTSIAEVDDEVRSLVERMSEVMRRSHGVGLAAPQVGVLRRVFVYRAGADDPVRVLINPQLGEKSDETEVDTEGCLSLLGGEVTVPVERHVRVVAQGLDESGAPVEVEAGGARGARDPARARPPGRRPHHRPGSQGGPPRSSAGAAPEGVRVAFFGTSAFGAGALHRLVGAGRDRRRLRGVAARPPGGPRAPHRVPARGGGGRRAGAAR